MTQFLFDTAGKLAVLARGTLADPLKTQGRLLALVDDIRREATVAQSAAERERDLLLANNALEERARLAEMKAKALEEHIAESAAAYTTTFISMSRRRRQYREALKAIASIAAEKLADMQTFDHAALAHGRDHDPVRTADAAAAISSARALLGEV